MVRVVAFYMSLLLPCIEKVTVANGVVDVYNVESFDDMCINILYKIIIIQKLDPPICRSLNTAIPELNTKLI